MHDNLNDIIKQRYAAYSRGSCLWSGDTESVTVFGAKGVQVYRNDEKECQEYIDRDETKVNYSVYFTLAEWTEHGAEIVMPDGFGLYRIRTTSYNTVSNLINEYALVKRIWRGPFAGIPFELALSNRQGNGPDGKKRNYPVFNFTLKPRGGELRLTSGNFRQLVESGNQAAADLSLPPPSSGSAEDDAAYAFIAEAESSAPATNQNLISDEEHAHIYPVETEAELATYRKEEGLPDLGDADDADFTPVEPIEAQLRDLEQNKDRDKMRKLWFATVDDSFLSTDEGRATFLARHVDGLSSLADVIGLLRPDQFSELLVIAQSEIIENEKEGEAQAKLASPQGWHTSVSPTQARWLVEMVRLSGLKRTEVYSFISMVVSRAVSDRAEVTAADVDAVLKATGTLTNDGWTYSETRAADQLINFASWQTSDDAALGVL